MGDDTRELLAGTEVAVQGSGLAARVAADLLRQVGAQIVGTPDAATAIAIAQEAVPGSSAPIRVAITSGLPFASGDLDAIDVEALAAARGGVFATAISGQAGDGVAFIDVPIASVATAVQVVTMAAAARFAGGERLLTARLCDAPAFQKGTEFSESEHLDTVRATPLAASGLYRASDSRWLQLDAPSQRISTRLRHGLVDAGTPTAGLEGLLAEFGTLDAAGVAALRGHLSAAFASRPAGEWEELLARADVPIAVCRVSFDEWRSLGRTSPALSFRAGSPVDAAHRPTSARPPRVLDLSTIIAGPVCGRTLAALGFDVIKIEEPGEKPLWYPHLHVDAHRGKRHAVLDLKTRAGRARFEALVCDADVVIENARPGTWERLGLGYDALRRLNPALVYASINLYGPGHGASAWPGYETTAQAAVGLMHRFGIGHPRPRRAGGGAINDYAAGMLAAFGVLCALQRAHEGRGGGHVTTTLCGAAELYASHAPAQVVAPPGRSAASRLWEASDGSVYAVLPSEVATRLRRVDGEAVADLIARVRGLGGQAVRAVNDAALRERLMSEDRYRRRQQDAWGWVGHVGLGVTGEPPLADPWLDSPGWDADGVPVRDGEGWPRRDQAGAGGSAVS